MLVPMLAGSYFMEKPPLFYWFATSSAYTFGGALSLPDAVRITVALFVYPTLGFLAATGRVLFGHARMWLAPILYVSALGLFDKVHLLVTDVGLLCGLSIGFFGLVVAPRAPLGAGLAMGCGGAIAFMCKGLLGPGILAVAALACRAVLIFATERGYGLPPHPYWLIPVRDLLSFAVFVAGFVARDVSWRGHHYELMSKGILKPDRRSRPP